VYVTGEVGKIGAFELGERESVSVIQALTLAGGFTRDANRSKVRVLRPIGDSSRRAEIDIDMKQIFDGKANDFPLLPNDVLYVPRSNKRQFFTSIATYGLPLIPLVITLAVR